MWHVGSVILWLGSSVTFEVAVYPSLRTLNQDESGSKLRSFLPKFSRLLGAATVSAAVAGTFLFGYVTTVTSAITPTGWRLVFVFVGALLGLIAAFLTLGVALPLAGRFLNPSSQVSNGPRYSVLDEATIAGGLNGVVRSIVIILVMVFVLMMMSAYW